MHTRLVPVLVCVGLLANVFLVCGKLHVDIDVTRASPDTIHAPWKCQLVWKPWPSWKEKPPKFDSYMREAGLVMPAGYDIFDGRMWISDVALFTDSTISIDTSHPLFTAIDAVVAGALRPRIDLGQVPSFMVSPSGSLPPHSTDFGWSDVAPTDYGHYYQYVRVLFEYLARRYGKSAVAGWSFQLLREPDNPCSWDPFNRERYLDRKRRRIVNRRAFNRLDSETLTEYKRLYDHTLSAMRSVLGGGIVLNPGNFVSLECSREWVQPNCWVRDFAQWLSGGSPSMCLLGESALPRIPPGCTTVWSYSLYAYPDLDRLTAATGLIARTKEMRKIVTAHLPDSSVQICVGEGNLNGAVAYHRGDGSEMGAAWLSAIYRQAHECRLDAYMTWGFVSASNISRWLEGGGIESASYNVVKMYHMMEGGRRIPAFVKKADGTVTWFGEKRRDSRMGTLCAARNDSIFALVYNFNGKRNTVARLPAPKHTEQISLRIAPLLPGKPYRITHYRVDRHHANFLARFHEDVGGVEQIRMAPDPAAPSGVYDGLLEHLYVRSGGEIVRIADFGVWRSNKERYRAIAQLTTCEPESLAVTDRDGLIAKEIELPANSVSLLLVAPIAQ